MILHGDPLATLTQPYHESTPISMAMLLGHKVGRVRAAIRNVGSFTVKRLFDKFHRVIKIIRDTKKIPIKNKSSSNTCKTQTES